MECPDCGSTNTHEYDYYTDEYGNDVKEYHCSDCFEDFQVIVKSDDE